MQILPQWAIFDPADSNARKFQKALVLFNILMTGFFLGMATMWLGMSNGT